MLLKITVWHPATSTTCPEFPPFIFNTCFHLHSGSQGLLKPIPAVTGPHRNMNGETQPFTLYDQSRVPSSFHMHDFGLSQEAREPGDNMQTPHTNVWNWTTNIHNLLSKLFYTFLSKLNKQTKREKTKQCVKHTHLNMFQWCTVRLLVVAFNWLRVLPQHKKYLTQPKESGCHTFGSTLGELAIITS